MVTDRVREVICVGLPGPSHNYGGLSQDNIASSANRGADSNPREAALQALALARLLMSLGVEVALVPPQLRPDLSLLKERFSGEADALIATAAKEAPALLESASSSSAMWVANAATVTPPSDTADGKLHLTIANLHTNLHRRIEAAETYRVFKAIFANVPDAVVHEPLASNLRDEGDANHMRLAPSHSEKGLHIFAYGTDGRDGDPKTARQDRAASKAIARQHGIAAPLFLRQHPQAIRAGVFHNDVIAVSNEQLLLVHEKAYSGGFEDIERIKHAYRGVHRGKMPHLLVIKQGQLSLEQAVHTYFFNSQIVTTIDAKGEEGSMAIIAPMETKLLYDSKASRLLERIVADPGNPIESVHYADLRQSMRNGGGPACLRLRVPMTETQLEALRKSVHVLADEALLAGLETIIAAYPDKLEAKDLADPVLYHRSRETLGKIFSLMKLPF